MRMGQVALLIWFLSPRCDVNTVATGRLRNAPSQLLRISERPSTLATTVTAQTPKLQAIANRERCSAVAGPDKERLHCLLHLVWNQLENACDSNNACLVVYEI